MEYNPFGESTARYKLADPFCIFYLNHVRGNTDNSSYWQTHEKSPSVISWMGFAFEVTKSYNKTLLERMGRVQEIVGDKKTVMSVLVTTYGLKRNEYASRFDRTVTMEDLFQK